LQGDVEDTRKFTNLRESDLGEIRKSAYRNSPFIRVKVTGYSQEIEEFNINNPLAAIIFADNRLLLKVINLYGNYLALLYWTGQVM
jgi:hypothetical protein